MNTYHFYFIRIISIYTGCRWWDQTWQRERRKYWMNEINKYTDKNKSEQ